VQPNCINHNDNSLEGEALTDNISENEMAVNNPVQVQTQLGI